MRRIVVGLAAGLLLGGSAIASSPPACADTFIKGLKVSHLVRVGPGWSVGLVTVTAGGGKVRHDDCLLYTSPSPRDRQKSRMPSSA